MNKIIEPPAAARQPLRIECVRCVALAGLWKCVLYGFYWRLYLHSDYGAGIWLNGERYELEPGRLYLLPPHCNLETWCDRGEVRQLYIHFETPQFSGSRRHLCNAVELSPELRFLSERLLDPAEGESPFRMLYAVALASSALARLPAEALTEHSCDHEMLVIADLMRNRPGHRWNIAELAERAGAGENEFIRRFRAALGSTPYSYLSSVRYTRAARLLEGGELSIDEICDAVGINDRFHFSRTFKRFYGCSPGAYRNTV